MFLKYLKITNDEGLIRRITFRKGMNLIVDDTQGKTSDSGNNVGKTTLLYLVNYCLGGKPDGIYKSTDNSTNAEIKQFLEETNVEVELCLADTLDVEESRKVVVRRNFLPRAKAIREINGKKVKEKDFDTELQDAIWGVTTAMPTFRQIISHSLRIDDMRLSQPLKTFPTSFGAGVAYETLHLYMFGANLEDADRKTELSKAVADDDNHRRRLEKDGSLSALNARLALVQRDIDQLEQQKASLKLNPEFEDDLLRLSTLKSWMNQLGVKQNNLMLRRSLIMEAVEEMDSQKSSASEKQVEEIYKQASAFVENLHHTFKELLVFHNEMLKRKSDFILAEYPQLEKEIEEVTAEIKKYRTEELALRNKLNMTVSYDKLDEMISKLSELNHEKGMLEKSIGQIDTVNKSINNNVALLNKIDEGLFSEEWRNYIQEQLNKFNVHFADISRTLYGAEYIVKFDVVQSKGRQCYRFQTDAANSYGSGKKQGEIVCFDLAYVKFADEEEIPCLHFTLYDKMELVHGNQLDLIAGVVEKIGGEQCIAAILRDKLPTDMDADQYIVERLTEESRLFKMEESVWYKEKNDLLARR